MKLLFYLYGKLSRKKRAISSFINNVLSENLGKQIFFLMLLNITMSFIMFYYCGYTNSMALTAFSYISIFNILRLGSCFITMWVSRQRPSFSYSFGYERFEVLSVFVCTSLTQLGAFFIFKERFDTSIETIPVSLIQKKSFERLIQPDEVLVETQFVVLICGSFMNFLVTHAVENKPFDIVSRVASSNWIQDILFDIGKSVCGHAPFLSRYLLIRMNPYILLSNVSVICVVIETMFIQRSSSYEADTIAAMFIAVLICVTMYPLSAHCAMILLQATPNATSSAIDKCLKEANTLDGLLEFRQENFWTISFGKYAGLLNVRIRRDANEQLILAQLTNKLSPYLHYVTIQIYKDDWKTLVESKSHGLDTEVENARYNNLRTKYTKTLPTANGQPSNYIPSYQSGRTNYLTAKLNSQKAPQDAKRAKYNGPKIDIDFG